MISCYQAELDKLREASSTSSGGYEPSSAERRSSQVLAGTISRLASSTGVADDEQGSSPLQEEERTCGVLRTVFSTTRYNPDNTIGRAIIGDRFQIQVGIIMVLASLALAGFTIGFLIFVRAIPSRHLSLNAMSVLLPLPVLAYAIMTFNCDLAAQVLKQRDTRIYHFWCAVFCACMIAEVQKMGILHFVLVSFLSLVLALVPFIDAAPPILRFLFNRLVAPVVLSAMILMQVSLYFNLCGCELFTISFFGEMKATTSSLASSALNNMIILLASNIVTAYRHPSSLVVIRSRVETLLLTESEATLLRAMDRNASDLSKRCNDELNNELAALAASARSGICGLFSSRKSSNIETSSELSTI
jgi:hypothetical protein